MMAEIAQSIDVNYIAEVYGFTPCQSPLEIKPINIDWSEHEAVIQCEFTSLAAQFDDWPLEPSRHDVDENGHALVLESDIHKIELPGSGFHLLCQKILPRQVSQEGLFRIVLAPEFYGSVTHYSQMAVFNAEKTKTGWELAHRKVKPFYRGQGVGRKMLEFMEQFVTSYATEKNKPQLCTMEASQLNVLQFFLSSGYEVQAEDRERFAHIMSALEAGDDRYVIAQNSEDFTIEGNSAQQWYVFERDYYLTADKAQLWQSTDYRKHSVRFTLEKKIEPVLTTPRVVEDILAK